MVIMHVDNLNVFADAVREYLGDECLLDKE